MSFSQLLDRGPLAHEGQAAPVAAPLARSQSDHDRPVSSTAPRRHYTYEEYLALDEASNVKLEYYAGDIFAMAGGTPEHAALCLQVGSSLDN